MTVTADEKKRVVLPTAKPGEQFDLQTVGEESFVLRRLSSSSSVSASIRIERRNGFSVGVSDQPIDEQALRDALADFP